MKQAIDTSLAFRSARNLYFRVLHAMIRPASLQKNDRVFVLNTSRKGEFESDYIVSTLERWGLQVVLGESVSHTGDCQFSAPMEVRVTDLQRALDDSSIKALFFCRGGYGLVQLIDALSFDQFLKHPKWLIGYSDITYLHAHVHSLGVMSLHASMLMAYRQCAPSDLDALVAILFNGKRKFVCHGLEVHRPAAVTGPLIGGNLSILHTVIGTPSDMDYAGKILLLEDVFENLMSIERMLYALKRSGKFNNLKALLLGDFVIPVKDNDTSNSIVPEIPAPDEQTIQQAFRIMVLRFFKDADFPIVFGLPVGHVTGRNLPVILGATVYLNLRPDRIDLEYKT